MRWRSPTEDYRACEERHSVLEGLSHFNHLTDGSWAEGTPRFEDLPQRLEMCEHLPYQQG